MVAALPEGWHTRVGQGGVGLSVGQRQRLALTRALVTNAPLVLLDEPTAHLDAASQARVLNTVNALRAAGRTVVVIAHRAALVALADDVVAVTSRPVPGADPSGAVAPAANSAAATGALAFSGDDR
ncbi:ATP-binding cassette domain-containing protein [Actinomyces ruminis]|uniref:ATP-binding cassette domain-containing protein n=1 Tax=Actinomyces ruminis TaxID=1937003 RepID=UPI0030B84867